MMSIPLARRHLFFVLAGLAMLMGSTDLTIVSVGLPQLIDALHAPLSWVGWTITAYELVQVIMLPTAGKLSDTLGRKRVFLFSVGTFTVGSFLCGLAPSVGALSISAGVLALSFFPDKALGLETIFRALAALLMFTSIALTIMIPDPARDQWVAQERLTMESESSRSAAAM